MTHMARNQYSHRREAETTTQRAMLILLGFTSFRDLARESGVSHLSVSDLFYKAKRRHKQYNISTFSKIFTSLTERYNRVYPLLDEADRRYVKSRILEWAGNCVKRDVKVFNLGKRNSNVKKQRARTERKVAARRAQYASIVEAFAKQ